MSRALLGLVMMLGFGACAVDEPAPPTIHIVGASDPDTAGLDLDAFEINGDEPGDDPCELAAALPATNMCSLICHLDELEARMIEDGMNRQVCYHLRCELSSAMTVSVGVCLP